MAKARLNHTTEGKMLVFTDHIMYEIKMLQMTYVMLGLPWYGGWIGNALIESFCIHARVLLEFFSGNGSESEDEVYARHFTERSYDPLDLGEVDGHLIGKLHARIAHLSYQRTRDNEDKIGSEDRRKLLRILNDETERFGRHLKSPYKEKWPAEFEKAKATLPFFPQHDMTGLITGAVQPFTLTPNSIVGLYREGESKK